MVDGWRNLDFRERRDPALSGRAQRRADARRSTRSQRVLEWLFAALNSVEMASLPWSLFKFSGDTAETPGRKYLDAFLSARLQHTERVLAGCEWLAGSFSIADILMADVLRLVDRFDGRTPRLSRLRRARHWPTSLREGTRRPHGAFCCSRLSDTGARS